MKKILCCLFILPFAISASLSRSTNYLCPNTISITHIPDNETEMKIAHQVELLNASNEELNLQLESLKSRYNEVFSKLADALNGSCAIQSKFPHSCAEIEQADGIYTIQVDYLYEQPFLVPCNQTWGGGWTVIQRRIDGFIDFYRNWDEYRKGFGNLESEFFIGLDKLHALTTASPHELLIVMQELNGGPGFAKYDTFAIGDESEAYALKVLGEYSGNVGDSLTYHAGQQFTTKDRDNDQSTSNCAKDFQGAWWYNNCYRTVTMDCSNLNGLYLKNWNPNSQNFAKGINWNSWHGQYNTLSYVQMMIRPKGITITPEDATA